MEYTDDPAPRFLSVIARSPSEVERGIREAQRQTVSWLREKPWLDGKRGADTVRRARRLHTESIARGTSP